jgi:hypothetical protein
MLAQAIVSNWRRPENVQRIVKNLIEQSVPFDRIIVVDNGVSHGTPINYSDIPCAFSIKGAGKIRIWPFEDNGIGPPCRFLPAIIDTRYKYTLFIDDDLLPGLLMHEHLQQAVYMLEDEFSTIGDVGRVYNYHDPEDFDRIDTRIGTYEYVVQDVPRHLSICRAVDLTCRAHFVHTENVIEAIKLRDELVRDHGRPSGDDDWTRHDDILLCCGVQRHTRRPSYILPTTSKDPHYRILSEELPDPHAMHRRPRHKSSREELINLASLAGWHSMVN